MVGVDELEEGLVVKEFGEGVVWVGVGKLVTGSLACARMVETGESADRVGYSSLRLLDNDLERKENLLSDRLLFS